MGKEDLIALRIETKETGYSLFLDNKEIHHVEGYKIKQADLPGTVELTIKMLVKHP